MYSDWAILLKTMTIIEDKNIPTRRGQRLIQFQLINSLPFVTAMVACVAGVIGEGEGERGRREKMRGIFSRLPRSPSPSPITPATQATAMENTTKILDRISNAVGPGLPRNNENNRAQKYPL